MEFYSGKPGLVVSLSAKEGHGGRSSGDRQGTQGQHHFAGWQRSQSREARWSGWGGASTGKGESQRRGRGERVLRCFYCEGRVSVVSASSYGWSRVWSQQQVQRDRKGDALVVRFRFALVTLAGLCLTTEAEK